MSKSNLSRRMTYSADTHGRTTVRIIERKRGVKRVNGITDTTDDESHIDLVIARNDPELSLGLEIRLWNTTVEGISDLLGNLRKRETAIKYGSGLGLPGDTGGEGDFLTVGSDNGIDEEGPMLTSTIHRDDLHGVLRSGSDVLESFDQLANCELSSDCLCGVFLAGEGEGQEIGSAGVREEDTVQERKTLVIGSVDSAQCRLHPRANEGSKTEDTIDIANVSLDRGVDYMRI
jgi:hypothetical protein